LMMLRTQIFEVELHEKLKGFESKSARLI